MRGRVVALLLVGALTGAGLAVASARAVGSGSAGPAGAPAAGAAVGADAGTAPAGPLASADPGAAGGQVAVAAPPGEGPSALPAPSPSTAGEPPAEVVPIAPTGPPAQAPLVVLPQPEPVAPPSRSPVADRVAARLDPLLADPAVRAAGNVAVSVLDANGEVAYAARATEPVLPASTQKLVVAAAGLVALGPEHRFTTTIRATAPVGPDGTLTGDLVLVGGGDPVLATPTFTTAVEPGRPSTPLAALADAVAAAGIRRVTGTVYGDASAWVDQPVPSGWLPSYLRELHGAMSAALTVDAGRQILTEEGRLVGAASPDPAGQAAFALHALLAERGVAVAAAASTRTPPPAPVELGAVVSPPLRDLLRHMVQTSDNQVADGVFRALGAAVGDATWSGSEAAARTALGGLGLDWSDTVLADGSGLSRDNRLTADSLTRLDLGLSRSALAPEWEGLMAVTGQSGTLRRRLVGTLAEGRVRGKTGTLTDVRALVGAVLGPDRTRFQVAVVGTELTDAGTGAIRALTDGVVLALAEELYGCVRIPVVPTDPAQPTPPPELRCAAA